MHYLFTYTLLLCCLIFSCKSSTSDDLNKKIKELKEAELMAKGEKVNSISIDSLQYEMVSLNNYYGEQKVLMQSQLSESITGNQSRLDHFKNTMTDSEYVAINATLSRDKQLLQNLDSLSIHSDSSVRLYKAHYWLRAVTDKKTYTEPQLIYLSQKEMKPITKTTE